MVCSQSSATTMIINVRNKRVSTTKKTIIQINNVISSSMLYLDKATRMDYTRHRARMVATIV
jgi:hypothetical protein